MCSGSSQCATSVFHFQLIDYHLKCVFWVKSVEVLKCAGGTTTSTACPRNVQQAASHLLGFDQLHCPRARTVPTHTLLIQSHTAHTTHTLLPSSDTHCPHTLSTVLTLFSGTATSALSPMPIDQQGQIQLETARRKFMMLLDCHLCNQGQHHSSALL